MNNILDFKKMLLNDTKISMVTCYDYWSAKILSQSNIDCILVGDSLAMVMHGYNTTLPATVELMELHVAAVAKGANNKFIIGDLPFCSYRKSLSESMNAVERIMRAGANAVKLEGVVGNETLITHIINSGIPVMGHIGLTPQAIHQLGGFYVQGSDAAKQKIILEQALTLEKLGCFAIVLECIPCLLAKDINEKISIPTIGIGAGQHVSGQVLVLQDLLGMNQGFQPKFLKKYLEGHNLIMNAVNSFDHEVKTKEFPNAKYSYEKIKESND